jgi:hemin uptake protein HemP
MSMMTISPKAPDKPTASAIRRLDLKAILGTDREVIICHGAEEYRLRLTSNDKLLLTK